MKKTKIPPPQPRALEKSIVEFIALVREKWQQELKRNI